MEYDIIIIGGGPAGLTAGIYCARGGMNTAVIEKLYAGGQAANTELIENYPGFAEGISGMELGMKMQEQAERLGCKIISDEVTAVIKTQPDFIVQTASKDYTCKAVILSLGAAPRKLGIDAEVKYIGHGISYCAVCDGALFRNKEVAVVGGGDTALSDALYLARFASKVYVIHRRDQLRATKMLQDRAFGNKKIQFLYNSVIEDLAGTENLETAHLKNIKTGELYDIKVSGVFVAIGHMPQTNLVQELLPLDENHYIQADELMHTSVPGLFAAGDARRKTLRQVITAASDGAIAAESAIEYINNL